MYKSEQRGLETLLEAVKYIEYENDQTSTATKLQKTSTEIGTSICESSTATIEGSVHTSHKIKPNTEPTSACNPNESNDMLVSVTSCQDSLKNEESYKPLQIAHISSLSTTSLPLLGKDIDSNHIQHFRLSGTSIEAICSSPSRKNEGVAEVAEQPPSANFTNRTAISSLNNIAVSSSNMHPLFARARAAVENASFTDGKGIRELKVKENVIYMPPADFTSSGSTVQQRQGSGDSPLIPAPQIYKSAPQRLVRSNLSSLNLTTSKSNASLSPHWLNTSVSYPGTLAVGENVEQSVKQDHFNSLMPSLVKVNQDGKVYAALQINDATTLSDSRKNKKTVTLTHNQLEKNRRAHLKECFEALKGCIPRLGMRRSSNLTILKAALRQIQVLKRKSNEYKLSLAQLEHQLEVKKERSNTLMQELLKVADKDKIEKFVSEFVNNAANKPQDSLLDEDQQSTSTASEAEEELRASMSSNDLSMKVFLHSSKHRADPYRNPSLPGSKDHLRYPPHSLSVEHVEVGSKPVSTVYQQAAGMGSQIVKESSGQTSLSQAHKYPLGNNNDTKQYTITRYQPARIVFNNSWSNEASNPDSVQYGVSKAFYGQPTGRSATPSPPSNVVPYFPRFNLGRAGSPSLHSSSDFELRNGKNVAEVASAATNTVTSTPIQVDNSNSQAISHSVAVSSDVKSGVSSTATTETLMESTTCPTVVVQTISKSQERFLPANPVSITTYSGYEVKVKYLTSTASFTSSAATTQTSQTHIPVKKRHFDATTFSTLESSVDKQLLQTRSVSAAASRPQDSDLQMTSLYVGASASVLAQSTVKDSISTSDNEGDRDLAFRDHKRTKHWRKSLMNERRGVNEWTQYRGKQPDKATKKKPLHLHPYEAPVPVKSLTSTSVKSNHETKPKATFNLWDRKHHAITLTTATNWRGKQQLVTSKQKTPVTSTSPAVPSVESPFPPSPHNSSVTQVSYSLLGQAPSKPAVLSNLAVGKPSTQSSQSTSPASQNETSNSVQMLHVQGASTSPSMLQLVSGQQSLQRNGLVHLVNPGLQQVQAVPVQLSGNPIGYQMIQTPASATINQTNTNSSAVETTTSVAVSRTLPPASNAMTSPVLNYITLNSHGQLVTVSANDSKQNTNTAVSLPSTSLPASSLSGAVQSPQMPFVIPFGLVMYPGNMPGGVAQNGLQYAKVLAPELMGMQSVQLQQPDPAQVRVAAKRSVIPSVTLATSPSRSQLNDSSSSSTISVESVESESEKQSNNKPSPKRRRISSQSQLSSTSTSSSVASVASIAVAQPQYVLPGNSGFVMAAPTSAGSGFTIPLNLVGYPFSAYPGGTPCLQAMPMLGTPQGVQAIRSPSQIWPMNPTVIPTVGPINTTSQIVSNSLPGQRVMTSPGTIQHISHVGK